MTTTASKCKFIENTVGIYKVNRIGQLVKQESFMTVAATTTTTTTAAIYPTIVITASATTPSAFVVTDSSFLTTVLAASHLRRKRHHQSSTANRKRIDKTKSIVKSIMQCEEKLRILNERQKQFALEAINLAEKDDAVSYTPITPYTDSTDDNLDNYIL